MLIRLSLEHLLDKADPLFPRDIESIVADIKDGPVIFFFQELKLIRNQFRIPSPPGLFIKGRFRTKSAIPEAPPREIDHESRLPFRRKLHERVIHLGEVVSRQRKCIEVFDEGTITRIDESPFFIEIGEPQNFGEIFLFLNSAEKFSQRDLSLSPP